MPTRRGWELGLGGVVVMVAGRLLGLVDLYVVGSASIILVLLALGWVRLRHLDLEATRRLRPPRVSAGGSVEVEIAVRNRSRRRSPVLVVRDPFDAGRLSATFLAAPLAAGEEAQSGYILTTQRRGVFDVGPLEAELRDPFGLATTRQRVSAATRLTVLPHVEVLPPLPRGAGGDSSGGASRPMQWWQAGDDFYALRPYAAGDDLRRVHWPSTARRDEVMIRQPDYPLQERTTVLVDLREALHTDDSVEAAVSAAASVVSAAAGTLVRLVDTGGGDSGYGAGRPHTAAILDALAAATPGGEAGGGGAGGAGLAERLSSLGAGQRSHQGAGTLVVVTSTRLAAAEAEAVAAMGPLFSPVVLVCVEAGSPGPSRLSFEHRRLLVVQVMQGQGLAAAWNPTVAGRASQGRRSRAQFLRR